jgi:uncharacterized OB-fold protein
MTDPTPATPRPTTTAIDLHLGYAHSLGGLDPYFQGLAQGRAVASRCPVCERQWFPPRLRCPDDHADTGWVELSGRGVVMALTSGRGRLPLVEAAADHTFALIALDGAENLAFGRIGNGGAIDVGQAVRLAPVPGEPPHPAQAAWFVVEPS